MMQCPQELGIACGDVVLEIDGANASERFDREVIEQAKRLAAERNTSVSAMFSRFIRALANGRDRGKPLGRPTRCASGVIDLKGRNHKDILADALRDKYAL